MKRKWLVLMLTVMTTILLAACGAGDKRLRRHLVMAATRRIRKKAVANSVLGWKQVMLRLTGRSRMMQMVQ